MTMTPEERLKEIHTHLSIDYGTLEDEVPEQLLAVEYIPSTACVLEIGGNIGRNSCVIGHMLQDSSKMVVVESDPVTADQLCHNRDKNGLHFQIEAAAISKTPMIQSGWDTRKWPAGHPIPHGWKSAPTISWSELKQKYPLPFDTLVLDCEGALYYILQEEPDFLEGIELIQIENDFPSIEHKEYCDAIFRKYGFTCVASRPLPFTYMVCHPRFFEVWKK